MYKLTTVPCIESHAYGSSIIIVDENGNTACNYGFRNQEDAFDYIKTVLEPDEQYKKFISNQKDYAKDIYDALDDWDKELICKYIFARYRSQCMHEYYLRLIDDAIGEV